LFGAFIPSNWIVQCVKNKHTYYLSEIDETSTKLVWTRKKENGKRFGNGNDATKCAELIKTNHNKKIDISILQV